jgi:hypothetical protein
VKIKDIFKSYTFHNIVAHPIMQLLIAFDQDRLGNKIHDATLPKEGVDQNSANTEDDHPEVNRVEASQEKES